jgi:hypothetical protein
MGRLTVRFQGMNLLDFDGTRESLAALKTDAEAMAFDVSQFVEAQIRNLISENPVTEMMLTCVLYRIVIIDELFPVVCDYAVSILPDANHPEGYRLIVERS